MPMPMPMPEVPFVMQRLVNTKTIILVIGVEFQSLIRNFKFVVHVHISDTNIESMLLSISPRYNFNEVCDYLEYEYLPEITKPKDDQ